MNKPTINQNMQLLLAPIKSSMSVILKAQEVWCNFSEERNKTSSDRCVRDPFIVTDRNVEKEACARKMDNGKKRRPAERKSLDLFTDRLVQKHVKKKAQAKRTPSRYKSEKRPKKARQVFTYSRPTQSWSTNRVAEGIDMFESAGRLKGMMPVKPITSIDKLTTVVQLPLRRVRGVPNKIKKLQEILINVPTSPSSCTTKTHYKDIMRPTHFASIEPKCFPKSVKSQPDLFYVVSEQSLPPARRYSSAFNLEDIGREQRDVVSQAHKELCVLTAKCVHSYQNAFKTLYEMNNYSGLCDDSSTATVLSTMGNVEPQLGETRKEKEDDFVINCRHLNNILAQKLASTITNFAPQKGKFMSYAKFNSSFKLPEDCYEDINRQSLSRAPTLAESLAGRSYNTFHRLNPYYDETQSLTEAMTGNRSPSSATSVAIKPDFIAKVCHHLNRTLNERLQSAKIAWLHHRRAVSPNVFDPDREEDEYYSASGDMGASLVSKYLGATANESYHNPGVSLSRVVSAVRKHRIAELETSLQNACKHTQKETDLWSTSDKSTGQTKNCAKNAPQASRRRLADVISNTEIFTDVSRPIWWYKEKRFTGRLNHKRAKLLYNFVSKAHHYMCDRDYRRSTMTRCYFRAKPVVRLVDEGVQCPDQAIMESCDRCTETTFSVAENSAEVLEMITALATQGGGEALDHELKLPHPNQNKQANENNFQSIQVCCNYDSVRSDEASAMDISHTPPAKDATSQKLNSAALVHKSNTSSTMPNAMQAEDQPTEKGKSPGTIPDFLSEKSQFNQSFRAICDKKRIRIKYENGKYTVYKEVNQRRQTVWSMLTGKATHLFSSVMPKKPHDHKGVRNITDRLRTVQTVLSREKDLVRSMGCSDSSVRSLSYLQRFPRYNSKRK